VLAGNPKQSEGPGLFLLSSRTACPDAYADLVAHRRLRVRRWEARRAWAGRLLIAISFPMAYLLVMLGMGTAVPATAARVVVWLWIGALAVATVCAEAAWRNRIRLDHIETGRLY
jgi:hypothetical protein